ncbi:MarR family winged helix-turn-helix transcriptional regulator [Rothia sp. (in: high G+C Gram-positive bacteria)]|uniref:MarR family winged helix-turn-helix transcriptional regulator n=1 Tax=Rothia sp. (in: high G+C Gram-positive bacteria) TaxID=1885016 RepID=UPI003216A11D
MHRRLRNESASSSPFTFSEETVLAQLLVQPRQTGAELARFQQITPQSMNVIVKSLLARGYLSSGKNLLDKRRKELYLTEQGTRMITSIQAEREEWLVGRVAEALTEEETQVLVKALPVLRTMVDRASRLGSDEHESEVPGEPEEESGE